MKLIFCIPLLLVVMVACEKTDNQPSLTTIPAPTTPAPTTQMTDEADPGLTLDLANMLVQLPLDCVNVEYPNKLNQVLGTSGDLASPAQLHPAFYGCFDWHSAVHGHWSLVSLLKQFPELEQADKIREKLAASISKDNILKEVLYFEGEHNKSFERTYGWAWLLKLALELHTWDDPLARELENNLAPLTQKMVASYLNFLPKLIYPIRVGEHTNTAFGLGFALDYANAVNHIELKTLIEDRAKAFYLKDKNCPLLWEPSGFDFLSPCLEQANLMRRVLPAKDYFTWLNDFLPSLKDPDFKLPVGLVGDRKDGKLVHLDGVNFSRAWCLYAISQYATIHDNNNNLSSQYQHLRKLATIHVNHSLPNLVGDSYEGGHWLGSFAIEALNTSAR